jgi:hypothetical protein
MLTAKKRALPARMSRALKGFTQPLKRSIAQTPTVLRVKNWTGPDAQLTMSFRICMEAP